MRIKTHPGEVLREEFMEPLNISARHLASELNISHTRVADLAKETRAMTPDTAIRLAKYFRTTPEFWINLQTEYDISKEMHEHAEEYAQIPEPTLAYA